MRQADGIQVGRALDETVGADLSCIFRAPRDELARVRESLGERLKVGAVVVVLAMVLALASLAGCWFSAPRPDVLLIVVDTLRADHLGAYGHLGEISPHVDALAAEGIVFDRAIAASTRTAPSHASIMTSLRVREHSIGSVNGATRLADERTLAAIFRDAGYETAAFISNWVITRRTGLDAGFGVYDDEMTRAETNRPNQYERPAPETAARAVEWLERHRTQPYFAWVHFQEPHGPYEPPSEYAERFAEVVPDDDAELPVLPGQLGRGGIPSYQALSGLRRPSEYRRRYAGEVAWVDEWVGRVVEAAERASEGRPLVVLLTADHGESLGEEDLWFAHGSATWPSESRVPLILRAPGLPVGRRSELVHHVDVLPTLLDLAGLEVPDTARGVPLGAYARRGEPVPERVLFSDIGTEVGVFHRDRYLRFERHAGTGNRIRWSSYRWRPDGGWSLAPKGGGVWPDVLAYVRLGRQVHPAPPLEPDEIERMRALGYVE